MLGPSERKFYKDFSSTPVSRSKVMFDDQNFPYLDLTITDTIKCFKNKSISDKEKQESSKDKKTDGRCLFL